MYSKNIRFFQERIFFLKHVNWCLMARPVGSKGLEMISMELNLKDLEFQEKFAPVQNQLIQIANIARMYHGRRKIALAREYFELTAFIANTLEIGSSYQHAMPLLDMLSTNGLIHRSYLDQVDDIGSFENPVNLGGGCPVVIHRLYNLYGIKTNLNPKIARHAPRNHLHHFLDSLETLKNNSARRKYDFWTLVDLKSEALFLNPSFLHKIKDDNFLEEFRLEGLNFRPTRFTLVLIFYRILIDLSHDAGYRLKGHIMVLMDEIEVMFFEFFISRYDYVGRRLLIESMPIRPIFTQERTKSNAAIARIWKVFFENLASFQSFDDLNQTLIVLFLQVYGIQRVRLSLGDTKYGESNSIEVTRDLTVIEGLTTPQLPISFHRGKVDIDLDHFDDYSIESIDKNIAIKIKNMKIELFLHDKVQVGRVMYSIKKTFWANRFLVDFALTNIIQIDSMNQESELVGEKLKKRIQKSVELTEQISEISKTVHERNSQISSLLKNVPLGVLAFGKDYRIKGQYSIELPKILGRESIGELCIDKDLLLHFNLNADQLKTINSILISSFNEEVTHFTINRFHLPTKVTYSGKNAKKILQLNWAPICGESGVVKEILLCIQDITAEENLKKEKQHQDDAIKIAEKLVALDHDAVNGFIESSLNYLENDISYIETASDENVTPQQFLFHIHTVKGNSRVLGFDAIADLCHQIEEVARPNGNVANQSRLLDLLQRLKVKVVQIENLNHNKLGRRDSQKKLTNREKDELSAFIESHAGSSKEYELLSKISEMLKLNQQYLSQVLQPCCNSLPAMALAQGKAEPKVVFYESGPYIPRRYSNTLISVFTHLFTNAMDHSIETKDQRVKRGKPEHGSIIVEVEKLTESIRIVTRDDGQGLNTSKIRAILKDPTASIDRCLTFIQQSGKSTKDEITIHSGRGVGLAAVRELIQDQGGEFEILLNSQIIDQTDNVAIQFVLDLPLSVESKNILNKKSQ